VAVIVLGIGSSHTPMLAMGPAMWASHAQAFDPVTLGPKLEEAMRSAPPWRLEASTSTEMARRYDRCQQDLGRLADAIADADPDVVVIVGDDQREMFLDDGVPAIATFCGESLWDLPAANLENAPPSIQAAMWSFHSQEPRSVAVDADLASQLASAMSAHGVDITVVRRQHDARTLGHAYTFVVRRLLAERSDLPIIPLFLNTYYPPNQPSPSRCLEIGEALGRAIQDLPASLRIAVVASGGLSHFVVDEELDDVVLRSLHAHDDEALRRLPLDKLEDGSSEIRNWIVVGAALRNLDLVWSDYVPAYRSPAGTGVGMGFAIWAEPDRAADEPARRQSESNGEHR
jgi:Catalytic LigB subunit of aromatic ring-opening dioxygenase